MAEKAFTATGRRKTSVARVWLKQGKGLITINSRSLQEYFGRETARMIVLQPFDVTQTGTSFDVDVNVKGGGSFGPSRCHPPRDYPGTHARPIRSFVRR